MSRDSLEAILLAGGASSRMGRDKASIEVDGEPLGLRIGRQLAARAVKVTVLGRHAVEPFEFLADEGQFEGPLAAIARFEPTFELVFVASCDLVRFDSRVIDGLAGLIGDADAALPSFEGRPQPLCALYRRSAIESVKAIAATGERRVMSWVRTLRVIEVMGPEYESACANVNTPEDLTRL